MAQLIVRNIEKEVVRRLRLRAAEHGRSAEAEHREILETVLLGGTRGKVSFEALLAAMPNAGTDRDFARSRNRGRKVLL